MDDQEETLSALGGEATPQQRRTHATGSQRQHIDSDLAELFELASVSDDTNVRQRWNLALEDTKLQDSLLAYTGLDNSNGSTSLDLNQSKLIHIGVDSVTVSCRSSAPGPGAPQEDLVLTILNPARPSRDQPWWSKYSLPSVTETTPTAALQKRPKGKPLIEWLESAHLLAASDQVLTLERSWPLRTQLAYAIGTQVAELQRNNPDISHLPLRPDRLFIDGSPPISFEDEESLSVSFADWPLDPSIGSEATEDTSLYLDPEEINSSKDDLSQAYALGIVILQILTPRVLTALSVDRAESEVWSTLPVSGFGEVIDELTEDSRELRVPGASASEGPPLWKYIGIRLREVIQELRLVSQDADFGRPERLDTLTRVTSIPSAYRYWVDLRSQSDEHGRGDLLDSQRYLDTRYLANWIAVAYGIWAVCLVGFLLGLLIDFGFQEMPPVSPSISDSPLFPAIPFYGAEANSTWDNLIGRLVAMSFAIIALLYYMRIISALTVRNLGVPLDEFSLRMVPIVYNLPAVFVIYWDPLVWPYAALIGIAATTITNRTLRSLDKRADEERAERYGSDDRQRSQLRDLADSYKSWWFTSLLYLLLLLVIAALYATNNMKPIWFFAALVGLGFNIYIVGLNSVNKIGDSVRGMVGRNIFLLRRIARVEGSDRNADGLLEWDTTAGQAVVVALTFTLSLGVALLYFAIVKPTEIEAGGVYLGAASFAVLWLTSLGLLKLRESSWDASSGGRAVLKVAVVSFPAVMAAFLGAGLASSIWSTF